MTNTIDHENELHGGPRSRQQDSAASAGLHADASDEGLWATFADAKSADEFCHVWLALQCRMITDTRAGLMLLARDDGAFGPAAVWPSARTDVNYLRAAAEKALSERRGVVTRADDATAAVAGTPLRTIHIGYPIDVRGQLKGAVVLDLLPRPDAELRGILRQLHWGVGWLEALFWQRQSEQDSQKLAHAAVALDVLAVAETHPSFDAAAMAVVNELAARLGCDRVSLGLKTRRGVKLRAMSRAAWFERKTQLVDSVEAAMEEAVDQNSAIVHPPTSEDARRIAIAHREFATAWGAKSVLTSVMTSKGRAIGAITLERHGEQPFAPDSAALAEMLGSLVGPVLELKAKTRRWVSGRLFDSLGSGILAVFGPRYPAVKVGAVALIGGAVWLSFAEGDFRVSAKSVIEGEIQRAAVAPFAAYISRAPVRAGDTVRQGDVLVHLEDKDLLLDRVKFASERDKLVQKHREALAKYDRPAVAVLTAQIKQADAQLALTEEKLARTKITAPIGGLVISGDLSQLLGSPVEQGKVLFEIAPLESYRVVLQVDERDLRHVKIGQQGSLLLTGIAGQALPFTVSKVTPVATAGEGKNFFRVEAKLADARAKLRPGMEGVGKVDIEPRPLLWIWTHRLVDWARLSLWKWTP